MYKSYFSICTSIRIYVHIYKCRKTVNSMCTFPLSCIDINHIYRKGCSIPIIHTLSVVDAKFYEIGRYTVVFCIYRYILCIQIYSYVFCIYRYTVIYSVYTDIQLCILCIQIYSYVFCTYLQCFCSYVVR